jgi:hypothetical protein
MGVREWIDRRKSRDWRALPRDTHEEGTHAPGTFLCANRVLDD